LSRGVGLVHVADELLFSDNSAQRIHRAAIRFHTCASSKLHPQPRRSIERWNGASLFKDRWVLDSIIGGICTWDPAQSLRNWPETRPELGFPVLPKEFPVPLRREFCCKPLNSLAGARF
jgi:hypothetical protein